MKEPVLLENTEFEITLRAEGRYVGPCDDDSENAKRMRPLFKLAHKLSLTIKVGSNHKRKLREMASELTRLDEAPHLKKLHIIFENCGSCHAIQPQFDLVVGVLGLVELHAGVTVMLDSSLLKGYCDFQPSKYFDSLDKLEWIDTTYDVYMKERTGYEKEFDDISETFQEVVAGVASTGTEGHDIIPKSGDGRFDVEWDLVQQVQFSDPNITEALDLAECYKNELFDLEDEIWFSPVIEHLEKIRGGTRGV